MLKKAIPNLITFTNLSFGVLSILEIYKQNFFVAAMFIIIAALIDRYDGRIARFLNISSELGKNLDSLSDLISFGVAPGILIFTKYTLFDSIYIKVLTLSVLLIYVICGAYRLANYNISKFNGTFTGIPITISGFVLAIYSILAPYNTIFSVLSIILLALFAYLMVSKIKFKKI
jgi:CDP-diacylglycerol--serine O-phosphatidyltransferase